MCVCVYPLSLWITVCVLALFRLIYSKLMSRNCFLTCRVCGFRRGGGRRGEDGEETQLLAYNELFINSPSCLSHCLLSTHFSSSFDWPTCLSSPEHFKLNLTLCSLLWLLHHSSPFSPLHLISIAHLPCYK